MERKRIMGRDGGRNEGILGEASIYKRSVAMQAS